MPLKRVLIADDASLIRTIIKKSLTKYGYEVVGEAKNGQEAVDLYNQLRPDLLTLDLIMPEKEGIEVIQEIMKIDPQAKILVVSSLKQDLIAEEALKFGAKGCLSKPFDALSLSSAANKCFE